MLNVTTSSGHMIKRVSKPRLSAMVSGLRRGEHLIVEQAEAETPGSWYIPV